MIKYFGFIYEWIDSGNGKTYTGSHVGSIEDGYIGSGTLFKRAYKKRSDKFSRKILKYVTENNRNILLEAEQKYLNLIDWNNTYNISAGANGGHTTAGYNEEQLKIRNQKISKSHKGKKQSESHKRNISNSLTGNTRGTGNKGKKRTEEQNYRNSESKKGNPWTMARRAAQEKGKNMSEAVESFNSKIDEIKEDRQKFEILMDEFFDSKDINIKELLAEMMLHIIMTRGEELQIKFKELEDKRKMYGDWIIDDNTIAMPNTTNVPGPNVYPQWTYTDNIYVVAGSTGGGSSSGVNGTLTINNNSDAISGGNVYTVSCNTASTFNISDLDIDSIVEDIDFQSDSKVNTRLFENAVLAMSNTWNSVSAK